MMVQVHMHLPCNDTLTASAVTSEILHHRANHSVHLSTYPAVPGFQPSHPLVSNHAEVKHEVYPAVTRSWEGDLYLFEPQPVVREALMRKSVFSQIKLTQAYTQRIITTRLLYCLHNLIDQFSCMQRIYPHTWWNCNPLTEASEFHQSPVVSLLRFKAEAYSYSTMMCERGILAFQHEFWLRGVQS